MVRNRDHALRPGEALVNVTWQGQNGDLRDPVPFDAREGDLKGWVSEALRAGEIPGVHARGHVDLRDFVVDRFPPTAQTPWPRIFVRPKTPFG